MDADMPSLICSVTDAMSQLITELRRLIDSSSPSAGSVVMEVRAVVDDHMINITPVAGRTGDYVNQMISEYEEA